MHDGRERDRRHLTSQPLGDPPPDRHVANGDMGLERPNLIPEAQHVGVAAKHGITRGKAQRTFDHEAGHPMDAGMLDGFDHDLGMTRGAKHDK